MGKQMHTLVGGRVLVVLLVLAVYWPGLTGGFVFDDYQNIVLNQAVHLEEMGWSGLAKAAKSSGAGPTGRPIAQVSFAVNHYFGGLDPWGFKLVGVLIHALNGLLVSVLVSRVTCLVDPDLRKETVAWFGLAVALVWALHPLNVSTVLYVVQRMNLLAATFTLLALLVYVSIRKRLDSLTPRQVLVWGVLLGGLAGCAIYSKENAVLLPFFLLLIEYIAFGFRSKNTYYRLLIRSAFAVVALSPLVWLIYDFQWVFGMYDQRGFTLLDNVLTQARVGWFYIQSIFFPDVSRLGLYHDDFPMSTSLMAPPITILAVFGHILLWGVAWRVRNRYRVVTFGIAWFYVGHALESTIFPLIFVFEHRNYLPSLGLLIIVIWAAFRIRVRAPIRLIVISLYFIPMVALAIVRSEEWGDALAFPLRQAEKHPNSVRANFDAGRALSLVVINHPELSEEYAHQALRYFRRAADAPLKLPEPYLGALQLATYTDVSVPDDFFYRLKEVLEKERPPNNVFFLFNSLRGLYANERQPLSIDQGVALYEAARSNPKLNGSSRGHMLASYALFLRERGLDGKEAQQLAEEAVTFAPGFLDNRILAGWLSYENGDIDKAERYLLDVERLDRFGVFSSETHELRAKIYSGR